jgi:hypothetical protein
MQEVYGVQRIPLSYTPMLWSIVFPLGMYAVANGRLSLADDYPPVRMLSHLMARVALQRVDRNHGVVDRRVCTKFSKVRAIQFDRPGLRIRVDAIGTPDSIEATSRCKILNFCTDALTRSLCQGD